MGSTSNEVTAECHMVMVQAEGGLCGCCTSLEYYLRAVKIINRDFSQTAGRTPIFEARIGIYDQIWVWNSVSKTLSTETLCGTFLTFSPSRALLAAMARRGGTTRPKATARPQQL